MAMERLSVLICLAFASMFLLTDGSAQFFCPDSETICLQNLACPHPQYCSIPRGENVIACERTTMFLQCDGVGKTVKIIMASYGRTEPGHVICPDQNAFRTDCPVSPNATQIATDACDGKRNCNIPASNDVFGDPCLGTFKYLKVQFVCI